MTTSVPGGSVDPGQSAQPGAGGPPWQQPPNAPGWQPAPPGWPQQPQRPQQPQSTQAAPVGAWVAGLVLVALGGFLLLDRFLPNAGEYIVLAVGLILLIVFLATGEYGFLVPGGIVTGIGAGIPLTTVYAGQLGGGLFLIAMGAGFALIWVLAMVLRMHERHPWPLVPAVILATIGAYVASEDTRYAISGTIGTAWPVILVVGGLLLMLGSLRRRKA